MKKIAVVLLIIIFGFIGVKFYGNMQKVNNLEGKISRLNHKIEEAETKNEELQEQLKDIYKLDYVEKVARKKLGLVKKGEILLVPVEDKEKQKEEQK